MFEGYGAWHDDRIAVRTEKEAQEAQLNVIVTLCMIGIGIGAGLGALVGVILPGVTAGDAATVGGGIAFGLEVLAGFIAIMIPILGIAWAILQVMWMVVGPAVKLVGRLLRYAFRAIKPTPAT